ncbi:hypothetical protein HG536_0F02320 [Torulaspora globosa]|uniref:N-acetyltransferase ECO1 n=1 Tax=Torulaspora globosa TaxID=48254 RepID=A0A7G3ZK71_9SACH|nr:uncharacterized protein HG536_0F02320 [Torulaspora globosa]QLL33907.1 hypothetical protein HG536_0F02320 [Torulaspora globosa]
MAAKSRSTIRSRSAGTKGGKLVQSRLHIGPQKTSLIKCCQCEMTYSPSALNDASAHRVYHDMHLKGRKWSSSWGTDVTSHQETVMLTPPSSSKSDSRFGQNERIVMIRAASAPEVKATMEIMNIVNDELNAPHDENEFWSLPGGQGKAFLYVKDNRAVGVVTVEVLGPSRGRWMVYESKSIIEHVRPTFLLGISRIWVCRTERHKNIATRLVEAARENTIYGRSIDKRQIAWSQPTDSGGKLAFRYNGTRHKSGKILIPCYI